jgi:ribosome-associated toxin RatA of RatAB toxin-antitoxin module
MPKVISTIEVPGEAAAIFDFLADFHNIPRLQPHFEDARLVSEAERGEGAEVELRGHFHGIPMHIKNRIVTFSPPIRLASISEGTVLSRNVWELRPVHSDGSTPATEVQFSVEYKITGPLGGIFTGLASSLFHGQIEAMTDESLRRLREVFAGKQADTSRQSPDAAP